jgi:membrane protease YdiL (CAAX protease family)
MPQKPQKSPSTRPLPIFTQVAFILGIISIGVMQFLYWTNRNVLGAQGWLQYTLYMTLFAAVGLFGTQLIREQPLWPSTPEDFVKLDLNTGVRAALILAASMLTQIIVQGALSFTIEEQALYFVFAAVCEELFFRVLILELFLRIKADLQTKVIGIVLQALMFTAIHQNYYANLPMLISVFLGGIILGIFYVIWRDPTANILGHFMLNVIAVQNLLVFL